MILDPFPKRTGLKIGLLSSDSVDSNELVHYAAISSGSSLFIYLLRISLTCVLSAQRTVYMFKKYFKYIFIWLLIKQYKLFSSFISDCVMRNGQLKSSTLLDFEILGLGSLLTIYSIKDKHFRQRAQNLDFHNFGL